jgi:hypothetical protein
MLPYSLEIHQADLPAWIDPRLAHRPDLPSDHRPLQFD